jgi:hypothetical protein
MTSILLAAAIVSAPFVTRVATIESGGKATAIGDNGKAIGAFQLHKGAWSDVSRWRSLRGDVVYAYIHASDAAISRIYATEYLQWLDRSLTRFYGRAATEGEIYAAYNCGLAAFTKRYHGNISETPKTTRRAIAKLKNI